MKGLYKYGSFGEPPGSIKAKNLSQGSNVIKKPGLFKPGLILFLVGICYTNLGF
jgi:hypothetical protein